ncbi:SAF domain-containing protein [Catellatospora chokoriensis]|uniref:SAF domain-containing protein n=1 Tax=Catellatospora chokoriensis TaxID=310353 RepID=UPI001782A040|nr:SAF domain-containing protein [Catellatospora chokoriensis]
MSQLVVSLLLVVVSAGGFALWQTSAETRTQVLAVARPVAAGQVLSRADLRTVQVDVAAGISLVRASELPTLIGLTAAVPLAQGSLLTRSQLGPAEFPAAGKAVVAVGIAAGRLPQGVVAGTRVRLVAGAAEPAVPAPSPALGAVSAEPVEATVLAVVDGVDGTGTIVVSVLVDSADGVRVAAMAGASVVIVGGQP